MIDPEKLNALVEQQSSNPLGEMLMNEEADADEDEEGTVDLVERGDELLTSMGPFGDELREDADILIDHAMELGMDAAAEEPSEETEEAAKDMADRMPPHLQEGLAEHIADKPPEDLKAIGAALEISMETEGSPEGEYLEEDAEKLGGALGLVAKFSGESSDDDEDDDDEDADDEDADDNPGDDAVDDDEAPGNPY